MNPLYGKIVFVVGLVIFIALRVPHDKKSKDTKVVENRKGSLEKVLLTLVGIGLFILPLFYITTSLLSFADYPQEPLSFFGGLVILGVGLFVFHRSHTDLSVNWSSTLELRENHRLVDWGIYKSMRHPMYSSFLIYGIAQALLLPNWVAGYSFLVGFMFMFVFRIAPEERMMLEKFGKSYEDYKLKTKRLIPGIW